MVSSETKKKRESPMRISELGIDLAKDVFQLHGVNADAKRYLAKK
jgi:hypothetical protein